MQPTQSDFASAGNAFKNSSGSRAVEMPCGDQLPSHRRQCRNNLVFLTAKTICKSSLGQLLAMEFDIDVKPCFSFSTFARLQVARRLHA